MPGQGGKAAPKFIRACHVKGGLTGWAVASVPLCASRETDKKDTLSWTQEGGAPWGACCTARVHVTALGGAGRVGLEKTLGLGDAAAFCLASPAALLLAWPQSLPFPPLEPSLRNPDTGKGPQQPPPPGAQRWAGGRRAPRASDPRRCGDLRPATCALDVRAGRAHACGGADVPKPVRTPRPWVGPRPPPSNISKPWTPQSLSGAACPGTGNPQE